MLKIRIVAPGAVHRPVNQLPATRHIQPLDANLLGDGLQRPLFAWADRFLDDDEQCCRRDVVQQADGLIERRTGRVLRRTASATRRTRRDEIAGDYDTRCAEEPDRAAGGPEITEPACGLFDGCGVDAGRVVLITEEPGSFLDLEGVRAAEKLNHLTTGRSRKRRRQGETPLPQCATRL
jgi:hypothetical protein